MAAMRTATHTIRLLAAVLLLAALPLIAQTTAAVAYHDGSALQLLADSAALQNELDTYAGTCAPKAWNITLELDAGGALQLSAVNPIPITYTGLTIGSGPSAALGCANDRCAPLYVADVEPPSERPACRGDACLCFGFASAVDRLDYAEACPLIDEFTAGPCVFPDRCPTGPPEGRWTAGD